MEVDIDGETTNPAKQQAVSLDGQKTINRDQENKAMNEMEQTNKQIALPLNQQNENMN